jgi:hypothetical protein
MTRVVEYAIGRMECRKNVISYELVKTAGSREPGESQHVPAADYKKSCRSLEAMGTQHTFNPIPSARNPRYAGQGFDFSHLDRCSVFTTSTSMF